MKDILEDICAGRPVIVSDDEGRENEGDLILAAARATPQNLAFMVREGRGLMCLPMEGALADRLHLPLAPQRGHSPYACAFTLSVDAAHGITTGISTQDRAHTIAVILDPDSGPHDLVTPGHIFPLRAAKGGVLERPGHTEAAIDLARLAGLPPVGVLCEIMNDDGTMARGADLDRFAAQHGLRRTTIAAIAAYRIQ